MAKKTPPPPAAKKSTAKKSATKNKGLQFTIDIGSMELTDQEVNSIGNEIAKQAVKSVRKPGGVVVAKEPYVKILHVKALPHAKAIKA